MNGRTSPLHEAAAPHAQEEYRHGFGGHLIEALASALRYIQARLELAGIESREAVGLYGKSLLLLIAAVGLVAFAYTLLWIGIVALVARSSGWFWGWVVLGASLLHLLGAAALAVAASSKWGEPVFTATLAEFRKDQEWLKKPTTSAKRSS
jgi:uncharacterized membrane protein YqjE